MENNKDNTTTQQQSQNPHRRHPNPHRSNKPQTSNAQQEGENKEQSRPNKPKNRILDKKAAIGQIQMKASPKQTKIQTLHMAARATDAKIR